MYQVCWLTFKVQSSSWWKEVRSFLICRRLLWLVYVVGLFVSPLLCLYSSDVAWLCCTVWLNILAVVLVHGSVSHTIYVLVLYGLHLKLWVTRWLPGNLGSRRNTNLASRSSSQLGCWRSAIWNTCSLYTKSVYSLGKPKALLIGNAGWPVRGMLPCMPYIHTFFGCVLIY